MAHSRNDIIREGVEAEIAHNAAYVSIAGIGSWVMKDEDIVDLVMSHVDPLIAELADHKAAIDRRQAIIDRQLGPCTGCVEAPEEFCPRHGRSYNDMLDSRERVIEYWMKEAENAQGINAVPPDAPRPVHGPEDGPDEVEDGHLPGL